MTVHRGCVHVPAASRIERANVNCGAGGLFLHGPRPVGKIATHLPLYIMTRFARELLQNYPRARSVFAYGSAAFRQPGLYDAPLQHAPMLDIVFAADNPSAWHHEVGVCPKYCRMVRSLRTLAHASVLPMYRL